MSLSVSFFSSLSLSSRPCLFLLVPVSPFSSLSLPSRLCLILPVSIKIPVSVSFCLVLVPRLSTVDLNLYHLSVAYTPLSGLQVSRFSICPTTICIIPSQPTSPHRYIPPQTRSSSIDGTREPRLWREDHSSQTTSDSPNKLVCGE